jgi:hypothetical protein
MKIEAGGGGHVLDNLAVGDLELGCSHRAPKDTITGSAENLRLEVLVEVRVFDSADEGVTAAHQGGGAAWCRGCARGGATTTTGTTSCGAGRGRCAPGGGRGRRSRYALKKHQYEAIKPIVQ